MPKTYAQIEQDLIALDFFRFQPAPYKVFLDVGAFDGIGFSNTRLFFEMGWGGVCIEPVLKNYEKLEKLYKNTNIITVRAAAADCEGELMLNVATIPWDEGWGSDVSSSVDAVMERWPGYAWEKEAVPAMTLNTILEKNNVAHVDFVSIDVEGQEMVVLRGFDLQKYRPALLVIEYSSAKERLELINHMRCQAYVPWLDNGQDVFCVYKPVLNNWKVFLFGRYQQFRFSRAGRFVTKFFGWLAK